MAIIPVTQLSDNYAYLIVDDATKECGVVDCAEADKVLAAVKQHGLKLTTVLPTHYHFDHVGGNEDLAGAIPGLRVYGARNENGRIPAQTHPVDDGDTVEVGGLKGRVIGIPAHTNGHVAYYFPQLKAVFTGDTLFIAGCGRVFEGKAQTMVDSLAKLAALPDATQVYCGHEYTEKNLRFALTLEPGNQAIKSKHEWTKQIRAAGKYSIPSTIGEEKQINPFLRTDNAELRASLKKIDPAIGDDRVAIFAKARELKDRF
ncbi:MAG TPA: hydroxyacylglutathione hydrolase [Candidatus Binataceae bacterium]|nr:hydroxyacylglutathione hydrolase [Candidatus Binataceae bacterium]